MSEVIRRVISRRSGRAGISGAGKRVHPTPTAGLGGKQVGNTPYRHCVQCGAINDTRTTSWSKSGDGIERDDDNVGQIVSGCAVCGSLFWQYSRPRKIKDFTENLSSGSNRRNNLTRLRKKRW